MPLLKFFRNNELLFVQNLFGRLVIGRSDRCDISLPGAEISRKHCSFAPNRDGWSIQDHSRHGTFIDGVKIDRSVLKSGMEIKILNYRIEFLEDWTTNQITEDAVEPEEHLFIITADKKLHSYAAELVVIQGDQIIQKMPLGKSRLSVGEKGRS